LLEEQVVFVESCFFDSTKRKILRVLCALAVQALFSRTLKQRKRRMKITKEEVLHVANLARLALSEEAIMKFAGQIDEILAHVDSLKKVDTQGIAPTSHAISLTNAFREDEVRAPLERDLSLANAPQKEDGSFVVPKIIE
jgi:aspartyl-tRNA(Asn)/glutamyl-tRNA(Gln) amidotransferase subunit C